MTVEKGLLILESILLVATIILLLYNIREGKNRKGLLLEIGRTTKILTRQEYFLMVIDSMMDANAEIIGSITGRFPAGDDQKIVRNVIENIERLIKRGVRITYLIPKFPDRLRVGYLYAKAGAEVRYSSCLMVHTIRFIIVDERLVILGIPETIGEKEATRKGYRIPSEGLAMILKGHFNACGKQISFTEYLKEVISQSGATPKILAHELQIDEEELKRFAG